MNGQKAWDDWTHICDAALVAPDTLASSSKIGQRYYRQTGQRITTQRVEQARTLGWEWFRALPSVRVETGVR